MRKQWGFIKMLTRQSTQLLNQVERFSSVKKIASFFGLHPVFKISGDGASGFRMSKQGRKEPRQILFMVALTAIRSNPLIREIYQDRVQEGMEKMAAIGLCMHKILRIIYGMLKHNTAFDPEVDRKNREKMAKSHKRVRQDKNRRYQDFDPKAPISRRQKMKKRNGDSPIVITTLKAGSSHPFQHLFNKYWRLCKVLPNFQKTAKKP